MHSPYSRLFGSCLGIYEMILIPSLDILRKIHKTSSFHPLQPFLFLPITVFSNLNQLGFLLLAHKLGKFDFS